MRYSSALMNVVLRHFIHIADILIIAIVFPSALNANDYRIPEIMLLKDTEKNLELMKSPLVTEPLGASKLD